MATLPVVCDNCGTLFAFQGIGGSGGRVQMSGNRVICPSCRQLAPIPDGTFELIDDSFRVLSAPGNAAALQDLIDLLGRWQENPPASADEAVAQLRDECLFTIPVAIT